MTWGQAVLLQLRRYTPWVIAFLVLGVVAFSLGTTIEFDPFRLSYDDPTGLRSFLQSTATHAMTAVIVSAVVFEVVERSAHARLEGVAERLMASSVHSVARTVAGEHYSVDVLEESMKSVFSTTLVRTDFHNELVFSKFNEAKTLVEIINRFEYIVHNHAPTEASFEPRFTFDNEVVRFFDDSGATIPRLTYVKIGNVNFAKSDLEKLEASLNSQGLDASVVLGTYKIPGQSELSVKVEHVQWRPVSYNSVIHVLIPTRRVRAIIENRIGKDFHIELTSLLREAFAPKEQLSSEEDRWERRYDGVVLPPGGWITSWHYAPGQVAPAGAIKQRPTAKTDRPPRSRGARRRKATTQSTK